ncbi:MAG: hypothetical protein ACXWYE_08485 [Actinomycetota bacterium]
MRWSGIVGPDRRQRAIGAALVALLAAACAGPQSTVPPPTPMPAEVAVDPRLQRALDELAVHPDRTAGIPLDAFTVTEVLPETSYLCVTLARPAKPPFTLAVDVAAEPWHVFSVGYWDPGRPDEYQVPYNAAGPMDTVNTAEVCAATLGGTAEPWPADPGAIDVHGYQDGTGVADAIRQAVFDDPAAFGIDRDGLPSISLVPVDVPGTSPTAPESLDGCLGAGVWVGGPRAFVHLRVRETGSRAWTVERVRLVSQAATTPDPPDQTGC